MPGYTTPVQRLIKTHFTREAVKKQDREQRAQLFFGLPAELKINTFGNLFNGIERPLPGCRIGGAGPYFDYTRRRTRETTQFFVTPHDRAILSSGSRSTAATWLDTFADWYDRNLVVLLPTTHHDWDLDGAHEQRFLSLAQAEAQAQTPVLTRAFWQQLCPKMATRPRWIRHLEVRVMRVEHCWAIIRPDLAEQGENGKDAFTLDKVLQLAPKLETLYLRMHAWRVFFRMLLAVKQAGKRGWRCQQGLKLKFGVMCARVHKVWTVDGTPEGMEDVISDLLGFVLGRPLPGGERHHYDWLRCWGLELARPMDEEFRDRIVGWVDCAAERGVKEIMVESGSKSWETDTIMALDDFSSYAEEY
ncbi:uncharacterized protein HMPREF1541_09095 [Cyphellophora europaea CBS 101466]|uniref:Uncharacterized protein n=1 Tax=Cyphellophora europaea (strain CBS 101466) TaxID=1220924 RepID=W2SBG2_CYPE1|nr:uncharacterized protein HMPREF1541_09095 [Cyphellophora europaea CBS 101466]ETN45264.1 hypothetical protein HMPREF1541_09095 [Cyphellophora europaea CBS 101466]